MSTMDACGIVTIKHSQAMTTKHGTEAMHNEHDGCTWKSDNQALTRFDHEHGTEA
jgi:hypothetical protein